MRTEAVLQRVDRIADVLAMLEAFVDADDKHGIRWELADCKLIVRWLAQDLEAELEAGRG